MSEGIGWQIKAIALFMSKRLTLQLIPQLLSGHLYVQSSEWLEKYQDLLESFSNHKAFKI